MRPSKSKPAATAVDKMLGEASWLLSHAQALADYQRHEEAAAEWARAAEAEEQVACLLEANGQELEAAIHRVSAASCHERLGHYTRAVTLLRAALSGPLHDDYRVRVERLHAGCLRKARKESRPARGRGKRKSSPAVG